MANNMTTSATTRETRVNAPGNVVYVTPQAVRRLSYIVVPHAATPRDQGSPDPESDAATRELLSDPVALQRVQDAEGAVAAGDSVTRDEMARLMEERRRRERPGA